MNTKKIHNITIPCILTIIMLLMGSHNVKAENHLVPITSNYTFNADDLTTPTNLLNGEGKLETGYYFAVSGETDGYYLQVAGGNRGTANTKENGVDVLTLCVKYNQGIGVKLAPSTTYRIKFYYNGQGDESRDRGLQLKYGSAPTSSAVVTDVNGNNVTFDGMNKWHKESATITTGSSADDIYWILGTDTQNGGGETRIREFTIAPITDSQPLLPEITEDYLWYGPASLTANQLFGTSGYNLDGGTPKQMMYYYHPSGGTVNANSTRKYINNNDQYYGYDFYSLGTRNGQPNNGIGFRIAQGKKGKIRIYFTYPTGGSGEKNVLLIMGDDYTNSSTNQLKVNATCGSSDTYLIKREYTFTNDVVSEAQTYWVTGSSAILGIEIFVDDSTPYSKSSINTTTTERQVWLDNEAINNVVNIGYGDSNYSYRLGEDKVLDGAKYQSHSSVELTSNDAIGFKIPNNRAAKISLFFRKKWDSQSVTNAGFRVLTGDNFASATSAANPIKLESEYATSTAEFRRQFDLVNNLSGSDMMVWISGLVENDNYMLAGYKVELVDITPDTITTTVITDDYVWNGDESISLSADAIFGSGYLGNNGAAKNPDMDNAVVVNGQLQPVYDFSNGDYISLTLDDDIEGELRVFYKEAPSGTTLPLLSWSEGRYADADEMDLRDYRIEGTYRGYTEEGTNYYSSYIYKKTATNYTKRNIFIRGGLIAGVEFLKWDKETYNAADIQTTDAATITEIFGNTFTWHPEEIATETINGNDLVLNGDRYLTVAPYKRQYFVGGDRVINETTVGGFRSVIIDNTFKQGLKLEKGYKYKITLYWDKLNSGSAESLSIRKGTDYEHDYNAETNEYPDGLVELYNPSSSRPFTGIIDLKSATDDEMIWITGAYGKAYYSGFKIEVVPDNYIDFDVNVPGIFTGTYKNKLLIYCTDNGTAENFVIPTAYYRTGEGGATDITSTAVTYSNVTYPDFEVENEYTAAYGSSSVTPGFASFSMPGTMNLFLQDHQSAATPTDAGWVAPSNVPMSIETDGETGNKYVSLAAGDVSGGRAYRIGWNQSIYGSNIEDNHYYISFDFNPASLPNDNNGRSELSVLSSITYGDRSSSVNNTFSTDHNGYLFDMYQAEGTTRFYSTIKFKVNGNDNDVVVLSTSKWYTITLDVNVATRNVAYKIVERGGGTLSVGSRVVPTKDNDTNNEVSMYASQLRVVLGRNLAVFNFDNVSVSCKSSSVPAESCYAITGFEDTDKDILYKVTYKYGTGDDVAEDYYYLWFANYLKVGWWVNRDAKLIVDSNTSSDDPTHIIVGEFYVSSGSAGNFMWDTVDPTFFEKAEWSFTHDNHKTVSDYLDYAPGDKDDKGDNSGTKEEYSWTQMNDSKNHIAKAISLKYPSDESLETYWASDDEVVKTVQFSAKRTGWPDWTAKITFHFIRAPKIAINKYYDSEGTAQSSTAYNQNYSAASADVIIYGYEGVKGGERVGNATIYYTTDGTFPTIVNGNPTNATYVYDNSHKPRTYYPAVYYAAEVIKTPRMFYDVNPYTTFIQGKTFSELLGIENQNDLFVARSAMLSVPLTDPKTEYVNKSNKFERRNADGTLTTTAISAIGAGGFEYSYPYNKTREMQIRFGDNSKKVYRQGEFKDVGVTWSSDANDSYDEFFEFDNYPHKTIGKNYSGQNGNPQTECNEGLGGQNTEAGGKFLQPISGDFLRFEPEYDGVITIWMRTNGAAQSDEERGNITRRPVYIMDENGKIMKRSTIKPSSEHYFSINGTYGEINSIKSVIRQDCRIDWLNGLRHWKKDYDLSDPNAALPLRYAATFRLYNYWYGFQLYQNKNTLQHTDRDKSDDAYTDYQYTMDVNDSWVSRTAMVQSVVCPYNSLLYHSEYLHTYVEDDATNNVTFVDGNGQTKKIIDSDKFAHYGYEVPAFNVVRYRFPVKAGKSYYIGGRGTKNGFVATKFDRLEANYNPTSYNYADNRVITEDDYSCSAMTSSATKAYDDEAIDNTYAAYDATTNPTGIQTYHLYQDTSGSNSSLNDELLNLTINSYDNAQQGTTCNVKLHRTFEAGKWYAIVLPFSVSETRMKEMFGDEVTVLYLDPYDNIFYQSGKKYSSAIYPAIREATGVQRLIFTLHHYQMLYANTPAFICPKGKDKSGNKITKVENPLFERVTLDKTNLGTSSSYSNIGYKIGEIGDYEYYVVGSYNTTTYSGDMYYLDNVKHLDKTIATIYHAPNGATMKGTRCWIVPYRKNSGTAPVQKAPLLNEVGFCSFDGDDLNIFDTEAGIQDVVMDDTTIDMYNDDNVYDLMGRVVGSGSLDGLPQGVYIFRGQKQYVR